MKVVIAIDSFKGSLTSMEAGYAAMEGVRRACPQAEAVVRPLADGGEGTAQTLIEGLGGEEIRLPVTGPLGEPTEAYYGILKYPPAASYKREAGRTEAEADTAKKAASETKITETAVARTDTAKKDAAEQDAAGTGTAETAAVGKDAAGAAAIGIAVVGSDEADSLQAGAKDGKAAGAYTAVMEMAQAAGITLVEEKDPLRASTRGVGEMILDAMDRGIRSFIIGIGGSATNDGGIGMLHALGFRFLDAAGEDAGQGAQALERIASVNCLAADERLKACCFQIACDVTNPLCGLNGATFVYGPQKGVTEDMRQRLDDGMANFADVTARALGKDNRMLPGAGAAGGLGFAFCSYLGARLVPGAELILSAVGLEEDLRDADILITGEGRLDGQTAMGKAPIGAARLAKKYSCRVIAFAGSVAEDACACNAAGIDAYFPIVRGVTTLEEAMDSKQAKRNMADTAEQVFRLIKNR